MSIQAGSGKIGIPVVLLHGKWLIVNYGGNENRVMLQKVG